MNVRVNFSFTVNIPIYEGDEFTSTRNEVFFTMDTLFNLMVQGLEQHLMPILIDTPLYGFKYDRFGLKNMKRPIKRPHLSIAWPGACIKKYKIYSGAETSWHFRKVNDIGGSET